MNYKVNNLVHKFFVQEHKKQTSKFKSTGLFVKTISFLSMI